MRVNVDGPRCHTCRLHPSICVCEVLPQLHTRTRLTVVLHGDELNKPTNTGGLAARCLVNSEVVPYGMRAAPLTAPIVAPGDHVWLLFPADDAAPLVPPADGAAVHLVVPDGTWRQAARMRSRVPGLAELRRVALPAVEVSRYALRRDARPGFLSTLEAVAGALRVLEGEQGDVVAQALLDAQQELVRRVRGRRGFDPRAPTPKREPIDIRWHPTLD